MTVYGVGLSADGGLVSLSGGSPRDLEADADRLGLRSYRMQVDGIYWERYIKLSDGWVLLGVTKYSVPIARR